MRARNREQVGTPPQDTLCRVCLIQLSLPSPGGNKSGAFYRLPARNSFSSAADSASNLRVASARRLSRISDSAGGGDCRGERWAARERAGRREPGAAASLIKSRRRRAGARPTRGRGGVQAGGRPGGRWTVRASPRERVHARSAAPFSAAPQRPSRRGRANVRACCIARATLGLARGIGSREAPARSGANAPRCSGESCPKAHDGRLA